MQSLNKNITQPLRKTNHANSGKKIMQPEWVSEWVSKKNHATTTHKNNATSPHKKKSRNHLTKKITQPVHQKKSCNFSTQKNHVSSPQKKSWTSQKSRNLSAKKNATSIKIDHATRVSVWVRKITQPLHTQKSCHLSSHTITQLLKENHATSSKKKSSNLCTKKTPNLSTQKNHATTPQKHYKNCKTLPWKHHFGCQICQITLSKSTEQVFFTVVTAVTVLTAVRKV